MKVLICLSLIEPEEIRILSSSADRFYSVTPSSIFNDAVCECPHYIHRGTYCKHIKQVEARRCQWYSNDLTNKIKICPVCNNKVIEYELEPEVA